jgi:hypothetical protein
MGRERGGQAHSQPEQWGTVHSTGVRMCVRIDGGARASCHSSGARHHTGINHDITFARNPSSRSSTRSLHDSLCPGQAASWHSLPQ